MTVHSDKGRRGNSCFVGSADWPLPQAVREAFGPGDSLLARYATRLRGVEINSSFYRPHQPKTYARWAASVPADFRFAVKLPRAITHERRLVDCEAPLDAFLAQVAHLGDKLGVLLIQLPPSLLWHPELAEAFFGALRERHDGAVVLEPRHASWFGEAVPAWLSDHRVTLVNADPAPCAGAFWPVDTHGPDIAYYRLHGAPRMYYSAYDDSKLQALARRLADDARHASSVWCIFDNTAEGAATANALTLQSLLQGAPSQNKK
jgi:uncharacterized protein YecE (DUF72 family)